MSYCLLMRFKDNLGTKNAIQAHQEIIEQKGYVWAGWWAKPEETLPTDKMPIIDEIIEKTGSLQLLLADSNSRRIYQCFVTEVRYPNTHGIKTDSPEPDCTPPYYASDPMYIWFQIKEIRDSWRQSSCLSHLSFADYHYFPTENDNDYSSFNNSTIDSIDLVFGQRRTLMLLRDKEKEDRTGIQWINIKRNFSSEYAVTQSNSILLISDLHFSANDLHCSEKEKQFQFADCQPNRAKVLRTLSDAICSITNHESFASLICAGDFTHVASEEEFNKANTSLFSIFNNHSIDYNNIVLVPGNHDMAFSDMNTDMPIDYTLESAKENYVNFYKNIIGTAPNEFCAIGRKILLKNKLPVEIVGINSCCLQQEEKHFKGIGFVGKDQIDFVEREMGWKDTETHDNPFSHAFRILVLHHHLFPIEWALNPVRDYTYSLCLDAVQIMHFAARNRINLIIHGHQHQYEFVQMIRWADNKKPYCHNVLGMGSASSTALAHSKGNCIGVLDFNQSDKLIIKILELTTDGAPNRKELLSHEISLRV